MSEKDQLELQGMDIRRAKPIDWAWQQRLVRSSFNLVVGNEGVGKGTLVAYVLARLTTGALEGKLRHKPCNVAVIGDEDSFDNVWAPRLWSVGCDEKRVFRIRNVDLSQVDIRRQINELAAKVKKHRIRVVYFDQILDNLAVDADHYHAKQVRAAISPLNTVATELKVTVLATLHPNKRAENFRQLVQGSSAFNAVSRSSLLVADHPNREDVRVLIVGKGNYARRGDAWEFKILEDHIRPNGRLLKTTRAVGFDKSEVTINELLRSSSGSGGKDTDDSRIAAVLREALEDGDWHGSKPIIADLVFQGFKERTVRRTVTRLGVERRKLGFQSEVEWRLAR